ncbi:hypothetical protein N6H13_08990 [Paenibacillus sp. CC-CFT742]|nr:hypothetical protein [Paenibacillus sp. CC-CFT742]WJH30738.1 hypothetical protein N6H13_08990 [Paenibacillus sp. CC-CFT742]
MLDEIVPDPGERQQGIPALREAAHGVEHQRNGCGPVKVRKVFYPRSHVVPSAEQAQLASR